MKNNTMINKTDFDIKIIWLGVSAIYSQGTTYYLIYKFSYKMVSIQETIFHIYLGSNLAFQAKIFVRILGRWLAGTGARLTEIEGDSYERSTVRQSFKFRF